MAYDFRSAGFELTNLVVELYRTRTYRRAAEEMSKKMLQSSVTAGQLISAVQDVSGADRAAAASQAIKAMDDMVYVISMMKRIQVYPAKALSPVMKLSRSIKARLIDIVVDNKAAQKNFGAMAPQVSQTAQIAQASQASQTAFDAQNARQPMQPATPMQAGGPQSFVDEDGFYDDATDYL